MTAQGDKPTSGQVVPKSKLRQKRKPSDTPQPKKRKRRPLPKVEDAAAAAAADSGDADGATAQNVDAPEQSADSGGAVGAIHDRPKKRPSSKLRKDSTEPRPSDRLRHEDTDPPPSKRDKKKAAREGKRLNRSKLYADKTEAKLGAAQQRLASQKPHKPHGVAGTLSRSAGVAVRGQLHSAVTKHERENVGVEAAHSIERGAETTARTTSRTAKRRIRSRPKRQAVKWERHNVKANAKLHFGQAVQDNPELKKNAVKRYMQKRRLKKHYQKQTKQAAKQGAVKAAQKTAVTTEKLAAATFRFVAKHPVATCIIAVVFLLVASMQSCMGGAFTIGGSLGGGVGGSSYLAEDSDINEAELRYTEWETDLRLSVLNTETDYPDYDEYRYYIGGVGHDPFALIAFLTAKYDAFTYADIASVLQQIFAEQYTLTRTATTETRGEGEDAYTVSILTTTLETQSFSSVIAPRLDTTEAQERYAVYLLVKGNRQYVGSPFAVAWLPYVSSYYGYRVHPISGEKDYHTGVDIALAEGTEILSGGDGTVLEAYSDTSYGLTLLIDYGGGITVRYAHCSVLYLSVGQTVSVGDVIALVGNTGNSTGAHLHIEVLKDGAYLNPLYHVGGTQ